LAGVGSGTEGIADGRAYSLNHAVELRPAIGHPNGSDAGSEEEKMPTTLALTRKAVRLIELCEAAGFKSPDDLAVSSMADTLCPAICMECGHVTQMEKDQRRGYCESCGEDRVMSGLILAGFI
jgi:hypothetical protein